MDLVAVTASEAAVAQLQQRLTQGAEGFDVRLRTPQDADPARAWWHEREGIWAILEPDAAAGMVWCSFGTGKPAPGGDVSYVCMANLSRKHDASKAAGVLAEDPTTHDLSYLHSGQFAKQTPQFAARYHGATARVRWPSGKVTPRYVIGKLGDRQFVAALAAFVTTVEGVKSGTPASLESA